MFAIPLNVAGVLAITPRPRGNDWLEDDMRTLGRHGVHGLVSLLEPPEEEELGLEAEGRYAEAAGLSFLSVPIPDLGVPAALEPFQAVIVDIVSRLHQGRQVAAQPLGTLTPIPPPSLISASRVPRTLRPAPRFLNLFFPRAHCSWHQTATSHFESSMSARARLLIIEHKNAPFPRNGKQRRTRPTWWRGCATLSRI